MKIISLTLLLTFLTINLYADKNWFPIESTNGAQIEKPKNKFDVNLSQIEPINKMLKNATVIKQLIDATSKKDKPVSNEKKWFVLNAEESK